MRFPVDFYRSDKADEKARKNTPEKVLKTVVKIISLVTLAGALQSCSALKLAYNQAPEAAWWYVTDYIDFKDTQKAAVKNAFAKVQQWHRRTQLPDYADTLKRFAQYVPKEVNAAQACQLYAEVQGKFRAVTDIAERLEPSALEAFAALEADQLAGLERKFTKSNLKYREENLQASPQARREKRLKQLVSRAEMLYGDLDERQTLALQSYVDQSLLDAEYAYAERLRKQQDTLKTLRGMAESSASTDRIERMRAALKGLLERTMTSPDPSYRQHEQARRQQGCQTFAQLHNSTSPAQRSKALDTLKTYEQDFTLLSRQF